MDSRKSFYHYYLCGASRHSCGHNHLYDKKQEKRQVLLWLWMCKLPNERCVDIAKALEITKPSGHMMMKTLSAMMLVRKTKYGNVFLSEDGKNTAEQYNEYYRTVCDYFEKSLCLSQRQAQRSALAVLSELSVEDIQNMCEQINKTREGTLDVS